MSNGGSVVPRIARCYCVAGHSCSQCLRVCVDRWYCRFGQYMGQWCCDRLQAAAAAAADNDDDDDDDGDDVCVSQLLTCQWLVSMLLSSRQGWHWKDTTLRHGSMHSCTNDLLLAARTLSTTTYDLCSTVQFFQSYSRLDQIYKNELLGIVWAEFFAGWMPFFRPTWFSTSSLFKPTWYLARWNTEGLCIVLHYIFSGLLTFVNLVC